MNNMKIHPIDSIKNQNPACSSSIFLRSSYVRNSFIIVVLSIIYGATLSQIPGNQFRDFDNYLAYAENSIFLLAQNLQQGIGPTLANEPVWLLINSVLGLFLDPDTAVRSIIFVSALLTAWLVLIKNSKHLFLLLFFLLLPIVIKNNLIHLRQGLAIAVFLLGWYSVGYYKKWFLLILAPFIHSSFLFILFLFIANKLMQNLRFSFDIRLLAFLILGVVMGLGLEWLASALGARQADEYSFTPSEISGFGFALWGGVALVWISEGRLFLRRFSFETGIILIYLGTYWFIEVAGRIFESGLIFVLIAGLALTQWRRATFLILVLGAGGFQWLARAGQPGIGFFS